MVTCSFSSEPKKASWVEDEIHQVCPSLGQTRSDKKIFLLLHIKSSKILGVRENRSNEVRDIQKLEFVSANTFVLVIVLDQKL